jgi:CHASE2 domain-containing sensor protein
MKQLIHWLARNRSIIGARLKYVHAFIAAYSHYQAITLSWTSRFSHKFLVKALLLAGLGFTAYAVILYATNRLTPNKPKASHDIILKTRFSSPPPAGNILILDIDEKTLAAMSKDYGRWPWSREVLADAIQKLSDVGAKGVLLNVMLSDPDKQNPDGDAAMEVTSQLVRQVAFPLIRLNPDNDAHSELLIASIPGAHLKLVQDGKKTLAAIEPMFQSMHDRLGVANQLPDEDGIIRRYPLRWVEENFTMPSIVGRTVEVANATTAAPDQISLNWRNKKGRYQRLSFSDFLLSAHDGSQNTVFKDAYVVVGLSAPGLGQTKATAVLPIEDDNEILATALDDSLNSTYLRTLPDWSVLTINIAAIWFIVWMAIFKVESATLNKVFAIGQSLLGSITLLSASYTNYLIDLSECMSFILGMFSAVKILEGMDNNWSRAKPGFRKILRKGHYGSLIILGFSNTDLSKFKLNKIQLALEKVVGTPRVVKIDDLFGGNSFIKPTCESYCAFLVLADDEQRAKISDLFTDAGMAERMCIEQHNLSNEWYPDSLDFQREVAPLVVSNCAALLRTKLIY